MPLAKSGSVRSRRWYRPSLGPALTPDSAAAYRDCEPGSPATVQRDLVCSGWPGTVPQLAKACSDDPGHPDPARRKEQRQRVAAPVAHERCEQGHEHDSRHQAQRYPGHEPDGPEPVPAHLRKRCQDQWAVCRADHDRPGGSTSPGPDPWDRHGCSRVRRWPAPCRHGVTVSLGGGVERDNQAKVNGWLQHRLRPSDRRSDAVRAVRPHKDKARAS
jgi:hypothetical protein